MGGLFKKPKAPPPDPKVEENLRAQEIQAEQERIETGRKISARKQSRVRGGTRQLMAQGVTAGTEGRQVEQLQTSLGRNPRSG